MSKLTGMIVPVISVPQQNCAILWDDASKQAVVVDPGGDVDRILAAIDQIRRSRSKRIWLTHGHLYHAGGRAELQETLRRAWRRSAGHTDRRTGSSATIPAARAWQRKGGNYGFLRMRDVTPNCWLRRGRQRPRSGRIASTCCIVLATHRATWCSSTMRRARGGGRCAVPGIGRPHRLPLWRPRRADPRHHRKAASPRR